MARLAIESNMLASSQSIVTLYEECSLSPEQIAKAEDLDLVSIKTILMQYSAKYRRVMKKGSPEEKQSHNFSPSEQDDAKRIIHQVMLESVGEDNHLALKAAITLRDDALGRKDVRKVQKGMGISITMIQNAFIRANEVLHNTRRQESERVIDIPHTEQKLISEQS